MYKQIFLKRGKEDSLQRFHPWLFSGAIHHLEAGISEGDVVRLMSSDGTYIATGHYQEGSIAVRVLTFDDVVIDDAFWHQRLSESLALRQTLGLAGKADTTAYRLVHGEGDLMPGLIIDIYGQMAVMQAHSIGMHLARHTIARQLVEAMGGIINSVYYKSEGTLAFMEPENGFIIGSEGCDTALENGLRFYVDWQRGQKTGFFVDQRDNRALLERYAQGRRVLNMFCYTGGFSFYAMRGGATLVHSVDSSAKAIELARRNVELNFPGDKRHEAFCEDAFRFLDNDTSTSNAQTSDLPSALPLDSSKKSQFKYDLIILDPPAFAKHRGALHQALKGYIRLNAKALAKLPPGGILFTFSCSQVVTKEHFRNAVFTAAAQARRQVRILHQLHQPADHPVNIYHPEGEYLKGLVVYVS